MNLSLDEDATPTILVLGVETYVAFVDYPCTDNS